MGDEEGTEGILPVSLQMAWYYAVNQKGIGER